MAVQLSTAVRNARLDAIETIIGTAPTLRILSTPVPADCAAAQTGTLLAEITLPSDWLANAGSGSKAIAGGPWTDASADGTGVAAYFRIISGATCHLQGTVTATGGGGDLTLANTSITATQNIQITAFTLNEANA